MRPSPGSRVAKAWLSRPVPQERPALGRHLWTTVPWGLLDEEPADRTVLRRGLAGPEAPEPAAALAVTGSDRVGAWPAASGEPAAPQAPSEAALSDPGTWISVPSPSDPIPAPAGTRFGAMLIDGVVLGGGYLVVSFVVGLLATSALQSATSYEAVMAGMWVMMLPQVLYLIASPIYYAVLNGKGQTVGKKALGIKVIDVGSGAPIGSGRAFLRYLVLVLMAIPLGLGYLSVFADERLRGWHDKAATTLVVRV